MNKTPILILLFFAFLLFNRAECGNDDLAKKPPFYFKCFINGAFREYLINWSYYAPYKDRTFVYGNSNLYGDIQIVWQGTKIASGTINVPGTDKSMYIWFRENLNSLDTFKTNIFNYKIFDYEDVNGKISGEFTGKISIDSLAKPKTIIVKPATDSTIAITKDTVIYLKVPQMLFEITKGEFSVQRSNNQ